MIKRSLALLTTTSALAAAAYPAAAQQSAAAGGEIEEIVVTGSRIQQTGFSRPTPVTVVSSENLEQAAPQGVAMGLNQLPQFLGSTGATQQTANTVGADRGNFLNLRNNGITRTLILMDGT